MYRHVSEDEYIESLETFQISNCLAKVELIVQYGGTISSNKSPNFLVEEN